MHEILVPCAQLELEADHEDAPVAADVESGHVSVPAGPRWGASYATQLRILFTRCAALLACTAAAGHIHSGHAIIQRS